MCTGQQILFSDSCTDHNMDVDHQVEHRLQAPVQAKKSHFTSVRPGGTDGRVGGRMYGHVTNKISRIHRKQNFLVHGALL